jgi:DNA-binding NtrC family response regulator
MLKSGFTKLYVLVLGSPAWDERRPPIRRYSVVFFSTSIGRATKLARVLSVAGIRVHHASTLAEVTILVRITSAGVVLIDRRTIGPRGGILRELAADFPDVCTVVLSPGDNQFAAELYAAGAWEIVVEPARFADLLAAVESAHELHHELTDPVRLQARVDAIMRAIRLAVRVDETTPGIRRTASEAVAVGVRMMRVVGRPGPVH